MIKIMAIGLFSDSRCRTIHGYLLAHDMDFLYDSLRNYINSSQRLKYILLGKRRCQRRRAKFARAQMKFGTARRIYTIVALILWIYG